MPLSEFDIIGRYFRRRHRRADVVAGVGDDCALLRPPSGHDLAVTTDTLIEGVHFPEGTAPAAVGHKTLAASLSDLAAMGAEPAWATLSASLPEADERWIEDFAEGLFALADRNGIELVGGDTVRGGERSFTLQAMGLLPRGGALRRNTARPGDFVFVTGTLGDAGMGLRLVKEGDGGFDANCSDYLRCRLDYPEARVAEGRALRGLARAAVDLSDGLMADLGHILDASGVGATVRVDALPLSDCLRRTAGEASAVRLALTAGDDYELCFTAAPEDREKVETLFAGLDCGCSLIGEIESRAGLRLVKNGREMNMEGSGYDHFKGSGP